MQLYIAEVLDDADPNQTGKVFNNQHTHEQFLESFYKQNSHIEILGNYTRACDKIKCMCKNCGEIFYRTPSVLLRKNSAGCMKCSYIKRHNKLRYTHEEILFKINTITDTVEMISPYTRSNSKHDFRCKTCGHVFKKTINNIFNHNRIFCPNCIKGVSFRRKTHEKFLEDLTLVHKDIMILEKYTASCIKIKCRCTLCNHVFSITPSDLLSGYKYCFCHLSTGEKKIVSFLQEWDIYFEPQKTFKDCKYINKLKFDFYIPFLNAVIEFNGKQHYESIEYFGGILGFQKTQIRDNIKKEYCVKNNFTFIEIPYYDFQKIDDILFNKFNKLGNTL